MPWREVSPMDQKVRFIADVERDEASFVELCSRYRISRKTGYKWVDRYKEESVAGLSDRSRRPETSPTLTAPDLVEKIVELRKAHPSWGGRKLRDILTRRDAKTMWPAGSTCCEIIKREGLVKTRRRRRFPGHPGPPTRAIDEPNSTWTTDFKGQFKTRDGEYCYPLTVLDGYSRFLLGCQGLASTKTELSKPVFTRLFSEYGLPRVIRSDNGTPFATTALGRLSTLSVWWIRLGIFPELIEPSSPQQNGAHERMHRTLKQETQRPPKGNLQAQQVCFNRFRAEYNDVRPHDALGGDTPASRYHPSLRPFPRKLPQVEYPKHFEERYVSANGGIRWKCARVNVTHTLEAQFVGLEEVGDGLWDVYFGPILLGRMDERTLRIEDKNGRLRRR